MVQLYDYRNRPINMSTLRNPAKRRFGNGSINGWERITDGTQVDPSWVANAIRQMERGYVRDFVRLAQRMAERFDPYRGALAEITDALGGQYRVTPASQSRDDRKIADAVKRVVEGDAFQLYLVDLRDAIGVGWSLGEMRWGDDAEGRFVPQEFLRVPPDAIRYYDDGCTPYLMMPGGGQEPLEWGRFINHVSKAIAGLPVNVGMAKACAYLYLFESLGLASYSGYLERFGIPIIYAQHEDGENEDIIAELKDVVASLGTEASAVFSKTIGEPKILEHTAASGNATAVFGDFIKMIDKKVRVAVLKVDMTDTGSGSRALGEVLERKLQSRYRTFAFQESAALRRDLLRPIMVTNFEGGAVRPAPDLWLDIEDDADMKALAEGLGPLIDRGVQVRVAEVLDRCGLPIPEEMDPTLMMVPVNSQAAMQNVEQARAEAAAERQSRMTAEQRAGEYAKAILRIVNTCDEPGIRKRSLVAKAKAIAREYGFDVSVEDAA